MEKKKVFCPHPSPRLEKALGNIAEVRCIRTTTEEEYIERIRDINILVPPSHSRLRVSRPVIEAGKSLEMIQTFSAGYEHIDVEAATKNGIIVCNAAGVNAESVSELALTLILDLARRVSYADRSMRAGQFRRPPPPDMLLWGKTLGVIGLGNIGSRTALKGRLAFNMRVLVYDPYVTSDKAELVSAELVDLKTLLKESDAISIHCALTEKTRGLIGEEELALMKPTALLVNTARGGIISEKALIKCLEKRGIGGAGLDVYEEEPLSVDSPLRKLDNIVLTPIIGTAREVPLAQAGIENIIRFIKGQRPQRIVNPQVWKE